MHTAVKWPVCRVALWCRNGNIKLDFGGGYLSSTASGVFRNRSHEIVGFLVLNDHEYLFKICILIFLNAKMQVRVVN